MSLQALADQMKSRGRNGDTELVHMTKGEVAGLQQLAMAAGGSLTINPDTGLPEASFLRQLLPTIVGGAVGLATMNPMAGAAAGAAVGGATNRDDPLMGALMGGIGGYGGAGFGTSLGSAGTAGAQQAAMSGLTDTGARELMAAQATKQFAAQPLMSQAGQGISALGGQPGREAFMASIDGGKGLMRSGLMAAAPMVMPGQQRPITPEDPGSIPEYDFAYNPTGYSTMGSGEVRHFRPTFTRRMAQGGIAALAEGGMRAGGFVVPADVVALLGEGNTEAGYATLEEMFPTAVAIRGQDGGQADTVETTIEGEQPAAVAHGEVYLPPEEVERAGGAKKLYAMLENVRQQAMGTDRQVRPVDPESAFA